MKEITATEAKKLIAEKDVVIIDIRSPEEYSQEHIPGSINLPPDEIPYCDQQQHADKVLLFHCRAGVRTQKAAPVLQKLSCQQSYCLAGGLNAWKEAKFPVDHS
jgi:rhodanese-related sulfurtransferase